MAAIITYKKDKMMEKLVLSAKICYFGFLPIKLGSAIGLSGMATEVF